MNMGSVIEFGNLEKKVESHNGWVIGYFIEKTSPLHSEDIEVKYHIAKKGEENESKSVASRSRSLTILVRGKFRIHFPKQGLTYVLEKEGDFIFWDPFIEHGWDVLEDSVLITVRWSSIPTT